MKPNPHTPDQEKDGEAMAAYSGSDLAVELSSQGTPEKYPDSLQQPIPIELPSVAGWKELPLKEGGEPMVPLGPFSKHDSIFTSSIYYGEHTNSPYMAGPDHLDGSLVTMFVREKVAGRLVEAEKLLPENHHLIVLDTYRSLDVQQALYDHYFEALRKQHPDWEEEALSAETQKYVSIPSTDKSKPSPHNTAGSVDLAIYRLPEAAELRVKQIKEHLGRLGDADTEEAYSLEMERIKIIREEAELLDFGTKFDHGGPAAALNYIERLGQERALTPEETEARDNRRLLYNVMVQVGMEPYEDEWWHYNAPESQMGAKTAGAAQATYGGVELSEENRRHEKMREMHHRGSITIYEGMQRHQIPQNKLGGLYSGQLSLNRRVLSETGDPRATHLPPAEVIAPPEKEADAA